MKRLLHLLLFIFISQVSIAQCDASFHQAPKICGNDSVYFVFDGQTSTDSFLWDFGDTLSPDNSDTIQNPVHIFSDTGTYIITLIVKDTGNCADTHSISVSILPKIKADFSAVSGLCFGDTTRFTFNGFPYNASYSWSFSDVFSGLNNTSSVQNPKHKFTFSGAYLVKLKITDTSSCTDSVIKNIQIYSLPHANFSANNTCQDLVTAFSPSNIIDAFDTLAKNYWNTGDSFEDSTFLLSHTYADSGLYEIRYKIETGGGCKDSISKWIRIYETPRFSISKDSACRATNIQFTSLNNTYAPTGYLWNFGDSSTSTSSSPIHQYATPGNFKINLRHTYPGNFQCTTQYDSVFIFTSPNAAFTINNDSQCYNGNNVCVTFPTTHNISYRRISFDDGFVDDFTSLSSNQVCYSYSDAVGGSYFITAELVDSNQCSNNFTFPTPVLIYPEIVVEYTQSTGSGCFKTDVNFTNTSNQNPPQITRFKWDFGDGNYDSTNWANAFHSYTQDGQFYSKLIATNSSGCTDSFEISNGIKNVNFIVDAQLDSTKGTCRTDNFFFFSQTPVSGASIAWHFGLNDSFFNNYAPVARYNFSGKYFPYVHIYKEGCDSILFLDTLIVSGPTASIGSVLNRYQCEIMDTVTFYNASYFYANQSYSFLWNFGDVSAPMCTTDTKNGINVGMNCNFSKDSIPVKHWYTPGTENCFYITLTVRDTVLGCVDQQSTAIALQKPIASPQPTANPPIYGLLLQKQKVCLGPEEDKTIYAGLGFTQPSCNRQFYWVMWDSTCAAQSGNFDSYWSPLSDRHNYTYSGANKPCSPDGKVTVGLIIQNGNDSTGNICRDTAWYHDALQFLFMDPSYSTSYDSFTYYCPNSTFSFSLKDSTQDSVTAITWNWGDGTSETDVNQHTRTHTYKKAGSYRVTLSIQNTRGCMGYDTTLLINIGLQSSVFLSKKNACVNDTVHLHHYINYRNNSKGFWNDSARAAQGKEHILWDFDDGNGFVDSFATELSYPHVGNHLIRLIAVDSLGCMDTLKVADTLHISGIFANFHLQDDTLVCAQLVPFLNQTNTYDSVSGNSQPADAVKNYSWSFSPLGNTSTLANPNIFLKANSYQIKLKAESNFGCKDSVVKPLLILGPVSHYEIISDSMGCQPFKVVLKNSSANANNYIWQFNDSANNTLITDQDTNIDFSYVDYGKYYPTLIAQGNFVKNGIPFTCDARFPDSTIASFREITSYELPHPKFYHVTDCSVNTTQFYDSSYILNGNIISYYWEFGDGDTSTLKNPLHIYSDTGRYDVKLKAMSDKGCEDSIIQTIVIAPVPKARFFYNEACLGQATQFVDSSLAYNDVIYLWEWSLDDTSFSSIQHPNKTYPLDTNYIISLKVTNIAGCSDSLTDTIRIHSIPTSLFSFHNGCDIDSISFVNTSYSKELPLAYEWDFGNNQADTARTPQNKYGTDGNFIVKLVVTTPFSCSDSLSQFITVYPSPELKYTVNNDKQCFVANQFLFADTGHINSGNYNVNWYFGDGDSAQASGTSHSYADTGGYIIKLVAVSDFMCTDTLVDSVRVFPSPKADFTINQNEQCLVNNTYIFEDKSTISEGNYIIDWAFDSQSKQDSIVHYQFTDTGFFDIRLKVSSNFSCADSVVKPVRILPMPKADFTIDDSAQCFSGNLFNFTNNSSIPWGNLGDSWQFGDGDSSAMNSPSHSYNVIDTIRVRLVSSSQAFCNDTFYKQIITFPMPDAGYAINDSGQCLTANQFNFSDTSKIAYGSLSYLWDFGNSASDTAKNPSVHYAAHGNFEVNLWVTSDQNCTDSVSDSVYVYPMPAAKISIDDTVQCLRGNVFLYTDSSQIAYGNIHTNWLFGDGASDTNTSVKHSYSNYGNYFIRLLSTSDRDCKDSAISSVRINAQPKADFAINDTIQCFVANHFVFINNSNIDEGNYDSYWNFGDNDTSTSFSTTHDYQHFGDFIIRLVVSSDAQCVDTIEKMVRIDPNPVTKISVNDTAQCFRGHLFEITDSSIIADGSFQSFWTMDDGNSDTNKLFNYSYNSYGKYTLKLVSTSDKNCTDSAVQALEVFAQPKAGFNINDSIQCLVANHFIFSDKSSIDDGSYISNWDFGDGDTSTQASTTHDYLVFGDFKVQLVVTSDHLCTDTLAKNNRVNPNPFTRIYINDSTQCENEQNFVFTDSSGIDEGTITRKWFLGDGDTSSQYSFVKTYKKQNTYTVKLVETSDKNCTDSAYRKIIVYPKPHASYTVNDTDQCVNVNRFNFNNKSKIDYGSLTYLWDFGDNQSDTNKNISHVYALDDTLSVRLFAISDNACKDTSTQTIIVFPIPETQFTINQKNQCVNTNYYSFDANATKVKYGKLAKYWWDLGDFHINPGDLDTSHIYATHDSSGVRFIALSEFGCYDTAYDSIIVYPKPKAGFTINDAEQCVNDQYFAYTNTSTIPYGTLNYYWNLGENDSSIVTSPNKVYANHDTLFVKLYAESDQHCWDTIRKRIVIFPKPDPAFTVNDSGQCVNAQLFDFTNKSTIDYGILKYRWYYGDGDTTTDQNPKHVYAQDDTFDVKMIAVSNQLCKDSITKKVIVYPKPTPDFMVNDKGQCINTQNFIFTNQSNITSGNMTYRWNFGDGVKDVQANATHHYFKNGVFNVKLVAISGFLCVDSITKPMQVFAKPRASFTVNDSEQCVNAQNFLYTSASTIVEGKIATHHWDFQNGFTGTASPVVSHFSNPGYYQVNLMEESDSGCFDTTTRMTRVYPKPVSLINYNDSAQCISGNYYLFNSLSTDSSGIQKFEWNIHNLKNSKDSSTNYRFRDTGFKDIQLMVNSRYNCWDTSLRQVYVKPMPNPDFTQLKDYYCDSELPIQLIPVTPGGTFYGQNISGDVYTPGILFDDTVEYYVTVNGCEDSSMQTTQVFPFPKIDLGAYDTVLCKREYLELDATFWKSSYVWQNGYSSPTYRIVDEGKYKVSVTNICGTASDSIYVSFNNENCHIYLPNAFTPTHDGLNDLYKPIAYDVQDMEYYIYNRWGELMYKGDLNDEGWNATFNGSAVAEGVFMVVVNYRYYAGRLLISETVSGNVTIIR